MDETYVKVRGQWTYLCRARDSGNTINFYPSPNRNARAAKRFLGKSLNGLKDWDKPKVINTDKAPTYGITISELKGEGKCPEGTVHRQVKYMEQCHRVRLRQAETTDPARTRFQNTENSLCDNQRL